jgi:hypothetical protein
MSPIGSGFSENHAADVQSLAASYLRVRHCRFRCASAHACLRVGSVAEACAAGCTSGGADDSFEADGVTILAWTQALTVEALAKLVKEATTRIPPSRERARSTDVREFPLTLVARRKSCSVAVESRPR